MRDEVKSSRGSLTPPRATSSMRSRGFGDDKKQEDSLPWQAKVGSFFTDTLPSLFSSDEKNKSNEEKSKVQAEHTSFLRQVLDAPIGEDKQHPIPQQIHRFWTGGKLSNAAMEVLRESAKKTKNTQWGNNLWYSSSFEKKFDMSSHITKEDIETREHQRDELWQLGYNIHAVEQLAEDPGISENAQPQRQSGSLTKGHLENYAERAMSTLKRTGKFEDVKHLSDVARLMYLYKIGGHHFDVDTGLGEMDLEQSYFHNDSEGKVPLMGAFTVGDPKLKDPIDQEWLKVKAGNLGSVKDPESPGAKVAIGAMDASQTLNGMIASRPNNPNIAAAIDELYKHNNSNNPTAVLSSGMVANPKLVYGPTSGTDDEKEAKRKLTVPPYLFELEHLTPEHKNRK